MKSTFKLWSIVMISIFALSGCSSSTSDNQNATTPTNTTTQNSNTTNESGNLELTLEELAQYNGQNGNPAYVAVDGVIYDVSDIRQWRNGEHEGMHQAGVDLSAVMKDAPHGREVLAQAKVVGKIKQ